MVLQIPRRNAAVPKREIIWNHGVLNIVEPFFQDHGHALLEFEVLELFMVMMVMQCQNGLILNDFDMFAVSSSLWKGPVLEIEGWNHCQAAATTVSMVPGTMFSSWSIFSSSLRNGKMLLFFLFQELPLISISERHCIWVAATQYRKTIATVWVSRLLKCCILGLVASY